jgi:hypothetical protein
LLLFTQVFWIVTQKKFNEQFNVTVDTKGAADLTENNFEKLLQIKAKHKEYCIGDKFGRAINEEDVEWLIEQSEKVIEYEQVIRKIASQSKVREGYILAPQTMNGFISIAKQVLKISE